MFTALATRPDACKRTKDAATHPVDDRNNVGTTAIQVANGQTRHADCANVRAVLSFLGLATAMTLQSQAEFRATQISAGRYDRVVSAYMYPLPVVYNGAAALRAPARGLELFPIAAFVDDRKGPDAALRHSHRAGSAARGPVPHLDDWIGYGDGGSETLVAQTICSCSGPVGAHLIEMIQFTHLSLPDLAEAIG